MKLSDTHVKCVIKKRKKSLISCSIIQRPVIVKDIPVKIHVMTNECRFGPSKCWFAHQENIENAYQKAKGEGSTNVNDLIYDME